MNKIMLIGNLTRDPEKKVVGENNTHLCKFTIAVNRRFTKNEVDYFNISVFGKMADSCQEFLSKGLKVAVSGSIQINEYNLENGETKQFLSVLADEVQFLTPRSTQNQKLDTGNYITEEVEVDENLPF